MQGIQECAVFNESLEVMNTKRACRLHIEDTSRICNTSKKGRGKSSCDPNLMQVRVAQSGDEICECSDQWTRSKQLYIRFYEFHSKKPSKACNLVYVVAVLTWQVLEVHETAV